jgi:hypothetical protein
MQVNPHWLTAFLLFLALVVPSGRAVVALGDPLPSIVGTNWPKGTFLVTLYTHSCAEAGVFEQHWQALAATKLPIIAVNVPENHWPTLLPPTNLESAHFIGAETALLFARSLKIRRYPTTIVIDRTGRMRAVIETPLETTALAAVLARLALR